MASANQNSISDVTAESLYEGIPEGMAKVMAACGYAAHRHGGQQRDGGDIPFITHPLEVVQILLHAKVTDTALLCAAALHDVVEDTAATIEDIEEKFGADVAAVVGAVTDDQNMPREERRARQLHILLNTTPVSLRRRARLLRMADKTSNLRSLRQCYPCAEWPIERAEAYISFCKDVYTVCAQEHIVLAAMLKMALVRAEHLVWLYTRDSYLCRRRPYIREDNGDDDDDGNDDDDQRQRFF